MKPYNLGLYEKSMPNQLSWKEKLQTAYEAGYDFLEMSVDESDEKLGRLEAPEDTKRDVLAAISSVGIPIKTMCLSGHRKYPLGSRDLAIRVRGMDIMEKAVCLATELDVRIIQLAGYDVYYEQSSGDTAALFEESLAKAVKIAAREGVILGFETMETEFMNTTEKAMRFVNMINSPYLQIYPDCGNLTNAAHMYGMDVATDLDKGRGHIAAIHLKETLPGVFREVPFGAGHVNFNLIVEAAIRMGVRIFVTEFWYTGNPDWKDIVFKTGRAFTGLLNDKAI